jgi:hypothetical protein
MTRFFQKAVAALRLLEKFASSLPLRGGIEGLEKRCDVRKKWRRL